MSKILDKSLCYLIGSIEKSNDQGSSWRKAFVDGCKKAKLGIKFLDPTNKISGLQPEIGQEHLNLVELRAKRKWSKLRKAIRPVIREDHRCVDISDFVVFYIDPDIHTCGSYFEFRSALDEKKPYFLIIKGGKIRCPIWLFGIVDHKQMFGTVEEVINELVLLDSGQKSLSDRWLLIRKQIEQL